MSAFFDAFAAVMAREFIHGTTEKRFHDVRNLQKDLFICAICSIFAARNETNDYDTGADGIGEDTLGSSVGGGDRRGNYLR